MVSVWEGGGCAEDELGVLSSALYGGDGAWGVACAAFEELEAIGRWNRKEVLRGVDEGGKEGRI
jgi:hypothetical protein